MTPTTMQIIAGQNVKANSKPGPTGFGFGVGHNPTAAAKMMVRSGAAPTTSKTSPTLTHIDLRYSRMDKCGLTLFLRPKRRVVVRHFGPVTRRRYCNHLNSPALQLACCQDATDPRGYPLRPFHPSAPSSWVSACGPLQPHLRHSTW